jgi:hypothetical protein
MKINLGARVVYENLLGPSSGIESLGDLEKKELCNVTLTSGQVVGRDDLQPHKAYPVLRAEELYVYGSAARLLLHIWDYVFRDGYVILPFRVLSRDDVN